MTTLLALRFVEFGGVLVLATLWIALGSLFFAIVRHAKRTMDHHDPRGL